MKHWLKLSVSLCLLALAVAGTAIADDEQAGAKDPHAAVYADNAFPSAVQCGQCHQRIFWEWASSNHAYAAISPMFNAFEQIVNELTSGTMGTFCVRCHQQAGTQRGEPRGMPVWDRPVSSREGITCVTCHRVAVPFGKVNGARHIRPGPVSDPVYGGGVATHLDQVLANPERFGIAPEPGQPGSEIHRKAIEFEQIDQSEFCVSCHQVQVNIGIKLEVVWDQYRDSPAKRQGITCQACHMGKVPGKAKGYDTWPIAIVNGRVVGDGSQQHSNHAFYGPGYSIAHPGLFPFNPDALRWSIQDWLKFDYHANWGRPAWEDKLASGEVTVPDFPAPWTTREAREQARSVVEENQAQLADLRQKDIELMENGSRIDGPFFESPPALGEVLHFSYNVTNLDKGHNLPSGSLGAQPQIWLNVVLLDPDGKRIWESGYLDSHGDVADLHSRDVRAGKLKYDDQLVNFQSKFLTTNVKGTDRELYVPIQFDVDQLPFLRPPAVPTSVLNHPPFARMEQHNIPPLGTREARYTVPAGKLTKPGTYKLQVRLRSRPEPIYFMDFVRASADMKRRINKGIIDFHTYAVEFEVR